MTISSLAHTNTTVITVIASIIEDDIVIREKKCTAFHTFNYFSALYRQRAFVCCV
jgi:hypothetical protein